MSNAKYFAYIRVSTAKQGDHGSSLAEQRSAIEAYAARNGLTISTWFEEVETAAKQGRRKFTAMMAALKAGKASGLVIHKIDRSARNLRDWADLGDLIDRGVQVRFVNDNFDLHSRGGRLSADIQAVVAADYIRNLREEVKKGIYGRLKQGLYPFAAPVGYLNTGKGNVKTIDPVKGPIIKQLFERYATGEVGFHALRREFYELGLRAKSGKPLNLNSFTLILNNPFYMGVIHLGSTGEAFAGAHQPLISKELFDRVQAILRGKTAPRAKKHQFLFRELVKCETCGRRHLTGEYQRSHIYYRCHVCKGAAWRGEELERAVFDTFQRICIGGCGDVGDISVEKVLEDFRVLVQEEYKQSTDDKARVSAALSLRLTQLDDRLSRLTDLLIDAALDAATYNARRESLLMERQGLLESIDAAETRSPLQDMVTEFERANMALLRYETLTDDEKRELIEIVSSNISVRGKSSMITLRTPYREIAELEDSHECAPRRDEVRTKYIIDILKRAAEATATTSPTSPPPPSRSTAHSGQGLDESRPCL